MDISMSEYSEDEIAEKLLLFYENLASDELEKSPKSKSLTESASSRKVFKVNKGNMKLNKTIEKISQKDRDKKKLLRLKKKKRLNKTNSDAQQEKTLPKSPKIPYSPNSHSDVSFKELENEIPESSISLSKYIDLVNDRDENTNDSWQKDKSYLCCKLDENGNLLVALIPNTKLYLVGNYKLKLILGNISVLGYKFKENEEQVIYSPPTHSTISINVHEGCQVKGMEEQRLNNLNIPYDWVQDFNISKDGGVVIVKLSRYVSNMTHILDEAKIQRKENLFDICIWREALGVELIEDLQNHKLRLQNESEEWIHYMDEVYYNFTTNEKKIFVICGGKSVGKSTFLKYVINKFLSNFGFTSVACIDLDPGQPEFSLPGCLTLSICSAPLLGPSFSHRENMKYSYQKQILLGDISVHDVVRIYLEIVSYLFWEFKRHYSTLPLIVNTMGFTATIGFDIMVDILRMTEPTHVISIESPDRNKNYPTSLTSENVSNINRGIRRNPYKRLSYRFDVFKTVAKVNKSMASRLSREVNIIAYLSKLWKCNEMQITHYTLNAPVKINWSTVAIHIFGSSLQPHVLLAINSSLVALCQVRDEFLYRQERSQPLRLQHNSPWRVSCLCLGWGVVNGTDPITKEIYIYTPLDKEMIEEVNLIALPNVDLPMRMRTLFSIDDGSYLKRV